MKLYIAGASSEIPRVQQILAALTAQGHEITHDWTAAFGERNPSVEYLKRCARQDLEAVRNADAAVILTPHEPNHTTGAWVEFGYAVSLGRPVYAVCPIIDPIHMARKCIFLLQCAHVFQSDTSLLEWMRTMSTVHDRWYDEGGAE